MPLTSEIFNALKVRIGTATTMYQNTIGLESLNAGIADLDQDQVKDLIVMLAKQLAAYNKTEEKEHDALIGRIGSHHPSPLVMLSPAFLSLAFFGLECLIGRATGWYKEEEVSLTLPLIVAVTLAIVTCCYHQGWHQVHDDDQTYKLFAERYRFCTFRIKHFLRKVIRQGQALRMDIEHFPWEAPVSTILTRYQKDLFPEAAAAAGAGAGAGGHAHLHHH